jgi:hypothetical protein
MGADNILLVPDSRCKLGTLLSTWKYMPGIMFSNKTVFGKIVGFFCSLPEFFRLLGYYTAFKHRRFGTTYQSHLQGSSLLGHLTVEDGLNMLSRNVGA